MTGVWKLEGSWPLNFKRLTWQAKNPKPAPPTIFDGDWAGIGDEGGGFKIHFILHIPNTEDGLMALLDCPEEKFEGALSRKISFDKKSRKISITILRSVFAGKMTAGGKSLNTSMTEPGYNFLIHFDRMAVNAMQREGSMREKFKRAGWEDDYLIRLLVKVEIQLPSPALSSSLTSPCEYGNYLRFSSSDVPSIRARALFNAKREISVTAGPAWSYRSLVEDSPSDWSTSYSQFLARSAAHASKTLQMYQEALACVAQGRLPPTVFEEYYPKFVKANASAYTERLTALGGEFLSSLTQLNKSSSAPQDEMEAEIPVPVFEPRNPAQWFEQYAGYAGQLNARAVKAYRRQLDGVAMGEVTPEEVQRKVVDQMSHQLPEQMQRVGQLYFATIDRLNEIRGRYEEEYFLGILALARRPEQDILVNLPLSGPLGGLAFASFSVTNTSSAKTPIRYVVTEIRRSNGVGAAFAPAIAISPEVLELNPGDEQTISVSLQLEPERYEPDTPYIGFLYVTGDGDLRVEMQLRIVATQGVKTAG